jgi:hypothetical protein
MPIQDIQLTRMARLQRRESLRFASGPSETPDTLEERRSIEFVCPPTDL